MDRRSSREDTRMYRAWWRCDKYRSCRRKRRDLQMEDHRCLPNTFRLNHEYNSRGSCLPAHHTVHQLCNELHSSLLCLPGCSAQLHSNLQPTRYDLSSLHQHRALDLWHWGADRHCSPSQLSGLGTVDQSWLLYYWSAMCRLQHTRSCSAFHQKNKNNRHKLEDWTK